MKERETRSEVAGFPQLAINEGKPPPQVCPPCGRGGGGGGATGGIGLPWGGLEETNNPTITAAPCLLPFRKTGSRCPC